MSTRCSIKWKEPTESCPGYHLYDDATDFEDDPPVYLRLDGVHVDLETRAEGGASVTVTLPRSIARELGLAPNAPLKGAAGSLAVAVEGTVMQKED